MEQCEGTVDREVCDSQLFSPCLFCFFFAPIYWLHWLRIVQQGLLSLPFLYQLHATVGHK